MNWRLLARVAVTAAIAVGSFEPFYIRILFTDRAKLRASLIELPYSKAPGLRTFLVEIEKRTPRGSRVAIAAPVMDWDRGYEYVYTRSLYPLAGREVLALARPVSPVGGQAPSVEGQAPSPVRGERPERQAGAPVPPLELQRAEYIAAWHVAPAVPGFVEIWRGRDGVLLRRVR